MLGRKAFLAHTSLSISFIKDKTVIVFSPHGSIQCCHCLLMYRRLLHSFSFPPHAFLLHRESRHQTSLGLPMML